MDRPAVTSATGTLGVIGDPVSHSLSPVLHNFVLRELGLDYVYLAFHVTRQRIAGLAHAFRTLGLGGLNVTIPHKEAVLPQMDELTDEARVVEAVNTIGMRGEDTLTGHNTDVAGFSGSLELRGWQEDIPGSSVMVLGAGGAARAVLYSLGKMGAGKIYLANRTVGRAEDLAGWLSYACPGLSVEVVPLSTDSDSLGQALGECALTVNVTPLGMTPHAGESPLPEGVAPREGSILFDTIYTPERTPLTRLAADAGCRVVGGLDMLIIQGMESLCWWLGTELPWRGMMDRMRSLLREQLPA